MSTSTRDRRAGRPCAARIKGVRRKLAELHKGRTAHVSRWGRTNRCRRSPHCAELRSARNAPVNTPDRRARDGRPKRHTDATRPRSRGPTRGRAVKCPPPGPDRRAWLKPRGMRVGVSDLTAEELAEGEVTNGPGSAGVSGRRVHAVPTATLEPAVRFGPGRARHPPLLDPGVADVGIALLDVHGARGVSIVALTRWCSMELSGRPLPAPDADRATTRCPRPAAAGRQALASWGRVGVQEPAARQVTVPPIVTGSSASNRLARVCLDEV